MKDIYTNLEEQLMGRLIVLNGLNINSCRSRPKFREAGCPVYSRYFMFLSSPKEGALVDLIENWDLDGFEAPNVSKEFPPLKVNVQRGAGGKLSLIEYNVTLEGRLI